MRSSWILPLLLAGCATLQPISSDEMKAFEVSLAVAGEQQALAWHGGPEGTDRIYFSWLDSGGRPSSAPVQITDGQRFAYEPDLQVVDGESFLAWYEKEFSTGALTTWLARLDASGRIIWRRELSAAHGNARNPVVRVGKSAIQIAWIETQIGQSAEVFFQQFDGDGRALNAPRKVGDASQTTWNLNAAIGNDDTFYVTYDARLGTQANELQLLAIGGEGVKHVQLSDDDGKASVYPDFQISQGGRAALTWFDTRDGNEEIYLSLADLPEFLAGQPQMPRRITHTDGSSIGAYLAWNGNRLALAWCDTVDGQMEIYTQTFGLNGEAANRATRMTYTRAQSSIPSIRASGDGFLIAWNEWIGQDVGHGEIKSSLAMTAFLR